MPPNNPHIDFAGQSRVGTLMLDATFQTNAPWTVLFGPSGSGKTTILRAIAGLITLRNARIATHGKVLVDTSLHLWTNPRDRPTRWAAQRAALFPHKTVRANLALGLPSHDHAGRRNAEQLLDRAIDLFELGSLADKHPAQLSGGERQRISVVRAAIGARGKILLLDEPFAGLDAEMRSTLLSRLRSWLGPTPVLSVTHDVGEAFLLDAEVVRLSAGRVMAQGAVAEVLAAERTQLQEALGAASALSAGRPVPVRA